MASDVSGDDSARERLLEIEGIGKKTVMVIWNALREDV